MCINDEGKHVAKINEFHRLLGVDVDMAWPIARRAYLRFVILAHPDKTSSNTCPVLPPVAPCNTTITDAEGKAICVTGPTPGTFKYLNQSVKTTTQHISSHIKSWSALEVLGRLHTLKKDIRTFVHRPLAFVNVPQNVVSDGGAITAHFINKCTNQPGSEVFELLPRGLYPVLLRGDYADVYFFERACNSGSTDEPRRSYASKRSVRAMHDRRTRSF